MKKYSCAFYSFFEKEDHKNKLTDEKVF